MTQNVIIEDAITVAPRPFDPTTDARKFEFAEAVAEAEKRASETSVRQRVFTTDVAPADAHIVPRYLIQAV